MKKHSLFIYGSLLVGLTGISLLSITGCRSSGGSSSSSSWSTFMSASLVLGQADFVSSNDPGSSHTSSTLKYPFAAAASSTHLYIADAGASRVVGYSSLPSSQGQAASFALGQANFTASSSGTNGDELTTPSGVMIWGTKLLIADEGTNKVLIWNTLPTSKTAANVVLGRSTVNGAGTGGCSTTEMNSPESVFVSPAGKVFVTDSAHNRVMIWNDITAVSNGAAADLILGDAACSNTAATDATMDWPSGVWSDDTRVVVVDSNHNRVMIWNTFPTTDGQAADRVIGQINFTLGTDNDDDGNGVSDGVPTARTMGMPWSVTSDGTRLFVSDTGNNRVLVWNSFPTANGQAADLVLGQKTFTVRADNDDDGDGNSDGPPTARTLNFPASIYYDSGKLYVTDRGNYRTLVFEP